MIGANVAVEILTNSGTIGSLNSTQDGLAANDPNNMIQLTGGAASDNLDIIFASGGANQPFSIDYSLNSRTDGYSTAYITSSQAVGTESMLKVVYKGSQGQQNDGIVVELVDSGGTDEAVVWNQETRKLQVFYDLNSGGASSSADNVASLINTSAGNLFEATAIGADTATFDAFVTLDSGTTGDGKVYDSITINLATDANGTVTTTAAEVISTINSTTAFNTTLGISAVNAFSSDGSGAMETGNLTLRQQGITVGTAQASGATAASMAEDASLTVTAVNAGSAYDNVQVLVDVDDTLVTAVGNEYATYDTSNKIITFYANSASTATDVVTNWASNSNSAAAAALFTAAVTAGGGNVVRDGDVGWLRGGVTYSGTSTGAAAAQGNFDAGDVVGQSGLEFKSVEYGEEQFVSVKALSGTFTTIDADSVTADRDYGSDANVRINGILAVTSGLNVSLNTSVLDFSLTLASTVTGGESLNYQIVSGGAQFQLGPDVVSNQQARLGIQSVNTAKLGGAAGRLFQLKSGGNFSLVNDLTSAAKVVEQAITAVTTLRGRLGAFQKTTLQPNIASLQDTLENLSEAESSIRDSDFAAESAALTRAQILVQSGISVLSIANSNPQNVLALLR